MSAPDTARAFAAAEAAYLEPLPLWDCQDECDYCNDGTPCSECDFCESVDNSDDWDEHEWEMRQDAKEAREGL